MKTKAQSKPQKFNSFASFGSVFNPKKTKSEQWLTGAKPEEIQPQNKQQGNTPAETKKENL